MISIHAGAVIAVVATKDPTANVNVELFTDVVDMSKIDQAVCIYSTGDMAAETIDFKAYSCDANGSNAVALKSATQLAAHATNNDNVQVVLTVKAQELLASGKQHVKFGSVTGGVAGGLVSAVVLGIAPRYGMANVNDLASVVQIKQ